MKSKIFKDNKIINDAVSAEWFFLVKRPDIPPLPVWHKMKISVLSKENKKIYGIGVPWAIFWYGNNSEFYLHGKEYRLAIQRATKILYSRQNLDRNLLQLKQACLGAKKAAAVFNNQHWKNFDSKKLLNLYSDAVNKYALSFVYGFITWCTPVLQYDAKSIINNYSQELKKINLSPDEALGILIVPDDLTDYQKKAAELKELSKKYRQILSGYKSKKFVLNNHPKLYKEIEKFVNKYYWVGFNYTGPALDYKAAVNELLSSRNKITSNSPRKKDIYKACKFNNKEKQIFYALEIASFTKDLRNVTDDYVHYCFGNFYNEVSKRIGLTKKDVQFLWDNELNELMLNKYEIMPKYIKNKRKFCAAVASAKLVGAEQYYLGDKARAFYEKVSKRSDKLQKISSLKIIKGIIASVGLATGRVKIINSVSEVKKVKRGDILVTSMTSPKYMPAILNSSAIITDEGGLTCHAAITARELKKPCIIGTKIATQVLHDGDLVEVDANKGIIKIVKKAS